MSDLSLFGVIKSVIDLTYPLNRKIPVYPGSMGFSIFEKSRIITNGKKTSELRLTTHTGTHIDSPAHVFSNGEAVDKISLDKIIGKALLLSLKPECYSQNTYYLKDLQGNLDNVNDVDVLIIKVGDSSTNKGRERLFKNYPVPDESVVRWILDSKVKCLGTDAISIDKINSNLMKNHKMLLGENVLIIEGLFNLNKVSSSIFFFISAPMKVEGADGAPCRAMAFLS